MAESSEERDWGLRADLKLRVSCTKSSSENITSHHDE